MRRLPLCLALTAYLAGNAFAQNANVAFKGPNPYYDLASAGLYAGSDGPIVCSIKEGSTTAACPRGIGDFAVGQGIEIPLAGPASKFNAWGLTSITGYSRTANVASYSYTGPMLGVGQTVVIAGMSDSSFNGSFTVTGNDGDPGHFFAANVGANVAPTASAGTATLKSAVGTVTPAGILNGSTTYEYQVVMRGYHGELSAASGVMKTTVGAATLGVNTSPVLSCSRAAGLATCTTKTAHNFQAGAAVDLEHTTTFAYNGTHVIVNTPSATSFTFYQKSAADDSGTATGGIAKVVAKNIVKWNMTQYAVLQSVVYRQKDGGGYSIVGVVEGMDGAFVDWGLAAPVVPAYIPKTPPLKAMHGILATTIAAIHGTTLTLANAASATTFNQSAKHDNTPIVLAGCAAVPSNGGGTLYIPAQNPILAVPFNSPLDMYHNCGGTQLTLTFASPIIINEPVIMKQAAITINSAPGGNAPGTQFQSYSATVIGGTAYPFFYVVPGSFGPMTFTNLSMSCSGAYQSCVVQDQDGGGGGVANISYDNITFSGSAGSMPMIMRSGGFNFWFNRGLFQVAGGSWGVPEALQITTPNALSGTDTRHGNGWSIAGIMEFNKTVFAGHGIEYNDWGNSSIVGIAGHVTFNETLIENPFVPWMSVYLTGANTLFTEVQLNNIGYADFLSGAATPFIAFSPHVRIGGIVSRFSSCGSGFQPLFEGNVSGGVTIEGASAAGCVSGITGGIIRDLTSPVVDTYQNVSQQFTGTGRSFFAMDVPMAPVSAVVSAGGTVAAGLNCYAIFAYDRDGGTTTSGARVCATVTEGKQTVTITRPTLPGNATGWNLSWFPQRGGSAYLSCLPIPVGKDTYVHSINSACGNAFNSRNTAARSSLGPTGISTQAFTGNTLDVIDTASPGLPGTFAGRLSYHDGLLACTNSDGSNCLPSTTPVKDSSEPRTPKKRAPGAGGNKIEKDDAARAWLTHRAFFPAAGNNNGVCSQWFNTTVAPALHVGANVGECVDPIADGETFQPSPVLLPPDWAGPVDVGIIFSSASTAGTMIFNVQIACSSMDGSATDDAPFTPPQPMPAITLKTPANGQWQTLKTDINTSGCTPGQSLLLKFTRATDTANGVANIRGYSLTYRTNNSEQ
jgi:hypothetical protein